MPPSREFVWREDKSSYFSCNELTSELVKEFWKSTVYTKEVSIGNQGKEMKSHTRKKNILLAPASSAAAMSRGWGTAATREVEEEHMDDDLYLS